MTLLPSLATRAGDTSLLSGDDGRVANICEMQSSFSRVGFQAMLGDPQLLDKCKFCCSVGLSFSFNSV